MKALAFIALTLARDGRRIRLRADKIDSYGECRRGLQREAGAAHPIETVVKAGRRRLRVVETFDQIDARLAEAGASISTGRRA